ncbi:hypothetical protein HPB51_001892 [Rhipicephalus microplus]|uniref:Uncharacterized protein n=1 Tax=Rhipicephalus microplus TaxID=6941 RepID=A0A9J6DRN5_RHIMP|nr:hypothetical protein HPB51_001892 [Rhipicephalus microplus]
MRSGRHCERIEQTTAVERSSASGTTSRGVVRGVDADLPDSELQRLFVSSHNPTLTGGRRIKNTTTIILLFDGLKVPNYVRCGKLLLRCTLYKRQIDTCRNCGRVGYRQDVCPASSEKTCEHCGIKPTGLDHECVTPKCALCGQAHITGDRTCPNRYQAPYVVRCRCRRRRRRNNNQQTKGDSATQQPTPKQQAPNPPTKHLPTITKNPTATPTWADRVTGGLTRLHGTAGRPVPLRFSGPFRFSAGLRTSGMLEHADWPTRCSRSAGNRSAKQVFGGDYPQPTPPQGRCLPHEKKKTAATPFPSFILKIDG